MKQEELRSGTNPKPLVDKSQYTKTKNSRVLSIMITKYENGVMVGLNDTVPPSTVRAFFYSQPFYVLLVILVFTEFSEPPPALMVICGGTFFYITVLISTFAFSSLWIIFHELFIYAFN